MELLLKVNYWPEYGSCTLCAQLFILLLMFAFQKKTLRRQFVSTKIGTLIFTWRLLLEKVATCEALYKCGILTSTRDIWCVFFASKRPNQHHICFAHAKYQKQSLE